MTKLINSKPSSFEEAIQDDVWQEAIVEEYDSIMKNQVWEVVPRPESKKVVASRWIYKVKHATDGSMDNYKELFIEKWFSQKEGIDYEEIFAHVAKYSSILTIISLEAKMGWWVHQMDVKIAFLNGVIEEEVYI